jgi:hypothetical protein
LMWQTKFHTHTKQLAQLWLWFGVKAWRKETVLGPRHRWEDGIRLHLREIGWKGVEWIQLAQDRDWLRAVVNTKMNLRALAPRS